MRWLAKLRLSMILTPAILVAASNEDFTFFQYLVLALATTAPEAIAKVYVARVEAATELLRKPCDCECDNGE